MQNISYRNEVHEKNYADLLNLIDEPYRKYSDIKSMIYLLALNERDCPGFAKRIFNFKDRLIKPDILDDAWLPESSKPTILLAFNLWNDYPGGSVYKIFGCSGLDKYYLEAIRIRFKSTCDFDEEAFWNNIMKRAKKKI